MRSKIILACTLAALTVPASAADIFRGEESKDAYIFADAATTDIDISGESESLDKLEGFSAGFGYKVNKRWAWEFTYRDLGGYGDDEEDSDSSTDFSALQFSLVAGFPINESFTAYGRFGVAKLKVESSASDDEEEGARESVSKRRAVVGIGARYVLSENTGLRLELDRFAKWDELTLTTLSLGFDFSF